MVSYHSAKGLMVSYHIPKKMASCHNHDANITYRSQLLKDKIITNSILIIMTKETKENIQITSAIAMLIGGFLLAVAGFVVPPTGQIHESVLGIFAECLIYAGSIFGVTIYIQSKYSELRSYLDKKLEEEQQPKK